MKNILYLLLLLPLCMACKKEPVGEPLPQLHFIDFVDTSGKNLFESGKIDTSEFYYVSGDFIETWEDLMKGKEYTITQAYRTAPDDYTEKIDSLRKDDNILLEFYQGNLERERIISINGVKHTFRYSLKDGFYEGGKKLKSTTNAIDEYHVYLHHVVLEEY